MKKIIGLLILLTLFSCANHPQDSLTFKVQYKPEKKYNQTTERTSLTVIKYAGTEKSLRKFKSMGVQNPNIITRKTQTELVLKTDKRIDETNFPVTLEYVKTISSDGKKEIPDGVIFNGQCFGGDTLVFNSIKSDGLDKKYKTALLQSVQNSFPQFSFPEKKLKIGEQFSIEHPLSMPMEGSKIDIVVTTNYKFISISNGIANFDISQEYSMNPKLMDNSFKGTGKGKGKLVYDIANSVILYYSLNNEMEINKKLDSFEFNLRTNSGFVQTTNISTN